MYWRKLREEHLLIYQIYFVAHCGISWACTVCTRVTVVGHEKVALLSIISSQFHLQHLGVVPHIPPLDVNGRLFLAAAGRILIWPMRLVQCPLFSHTHTHTHTHARTHVNTHTHTHTHTHVDTWWVVVT